MVTFGANWCLDCRTLDHHLRSPDGHVIGTTNAGQLEPARFYTSKQIRKFVRDIVEKSEIAAPDSVQ